MNDIKQNLDQIQQNIIHAEKKFHRIPHSIQLLAVSKTQSSERIREAWKSGQKAFGENYLQEALMKIQALSDLPIEWHFIGPIQNNKTRKIAEHFSWVHSVDNAITAKRLNAQRPLSLPPLNVCIQINISHEKTKSGILLEETPALFNQILSMSRLNLRGFMVIPEPSLNVEQQREPFHLIKTLFEQLNQENLGVLDTLSMGMSDDYIAAIAEGATIIRLGTALFGPRFSKTEYT